uniref:Carboxylic ester hydrolase n=1 Tax=Strongyloides stercoralis TaxID=6248 RepID=A0A0K0EEY6_STRER
MVIFLIHIFLLLFTSTLSEKVIKTLNGPIVGKKLNFKKGYVSEYLGVPFAQPPIRELRFMPPVELNKPQWKHVLKAYIPAISCPQYVEVMNFTGSDEFNPTNRIGENCLQLNMWVPKERSGATIVHIHGGGYRRGSASLDIYNGSVLASKSKAIVVNLNYRFDIFGFAYLGEQSKIKGNMGLLDQQMGLKWVYENIEFFGGDKNMITIFGQSAGAASATAHLFSKESKKYFRRLFVDSGVITNNWGSVDRDEMQKNTIKLVRHLKCPVKKGDEKLIKCLQKRKMVRILEASKEVRKTGQIELLNQFSPIDRDSVFFKGPVHILLEDKKFNKDVDLVVGRMADETSVFMPRFLKNFGCGFNPLKDPEDKENQCNLNEQIFAGFIDKVKGTIGLEDDEAKEYLQIYNNTNYDNYRDKMKKLTSDLVMNCPASKFVEKIYNSTRRNVYVYEFQKRSPINPWPKWMGAMHGRELKYIFGYPYRYPSKYPEDKLKEEQKFSKKYMKFLGKFAKYGDLGKYSDKFTRNHKKALVIDETFAHSNKPKYIKSMSKTCKKFLNLIDRVVKRFISKVKVASKFNRK